MTTTKLYLAKAAEERSIIRRRPAETMSRHRRQPSRALPLDFNLDDDDEAAAAKGGATATSLVDVDGSQNPRLGGSEDGKGQDDGQTTKKKKPPPATGSRTPPDGTGGNNKPRADGAASRGRR